MAAGAIGRRQERKGGKRDAPVLADQPRAGTSVACRCSKAIPDCTAAAAAAAASLAGAPTSIGCDGNAGANHQHVAKAGCSSIRPGRNIKKRAKVRQEQDWEGSVLVTSWQAG